MSFDPAPFAEAIRAANQRESEAIERRLQEALAEARRLAQVIRLRDPGVIDVRLFGSVAEGTVRSLTFDIDLAVTGGDIYTAMAAVENSPFNVDVVNPERLPAHIRQRIRERGIALNDS